MGAIEDGFNEAYRDFVTDGVAASGVYQPEKSKQRALGALISAAIANAGFGGNIAAFYATRAELDADLAHEAGAIGFVYGDAIDANNDLYIKTGASGAGGWTLTTALHEIIEELAQPYVDACEAARDALVLNFFDYCAEDVRSGYVDAATGKFKRPNDNWRTTPPIPAYDGQTFTVTATGSGAVQAIVAMWDKNGNYLGAARNTTAAAVNVFCSDPDLAYITASGNKSSALILTGSKLGEPLELPRGIFPVDIDLIRNVETPLFARSMVVDTRFPLAWDDAKAMERVHRYTPTVAVDTLRLATVLQGGFKLELTEIPVQSRLAPANPATPVNIICLGDSTTQSTGAPDGAGDYYDWVNELAWGIISNGEDGIVDTSKGRRALDDDNGTITPWGLSNVYFRGTRGAQTIKHEGRGGWAIRDYLDTATLGGVPNAFWDGAAFNLDYYLQQNNWHADAGSNLSGLAEPTGVTATGSNLRILIGLGWNDIRSRTEAQLIADYEELIDAIRATHADAKILLLGHEAPPVRVPIRRSDSAVDGRFLAPRHIMEEYLMPLDRILRTVAASKTVDHLNYAPQFDGDTCFQTDELTIANWLADTQISARDYVHAWRTGSFAKARAIRGFLATPGWIS